MPDSTATNAKAKAFKPRAGIVRKSKAERDAHAKEEAEKAAARAAAAAQAAGQSTQQPKSTVSKRREANRENRDGSQNTAGGVFGVGTSTRQGWRKSAVDGGFSEMLDGQEGIKSSDGPTLQGQASTSSGQRGKSGGGGTTSVTGGRKTSEQTPDGMIIESDDDKDDDEDEAIQKRHNIESIVISSDDDDGDEDVVSGKRKARAPSEGKKAKLVSGLRPVRAPVTRAEEETEDDERKEGRKTSKPNRTVGEDAEDQDEGEEIEIDDEQTILHHVKQDAPSSPEISRRGKPQRRGGLKTKIGKRATETFEERAERLRLNEDIAKLRDEFIISPNIKTDVEMDTVNDNERPDGKLFLFQFPPLVPFLVDQDSIPQMGSDETPNIKNDPDSLAISNTESAENPSIPKTQMEGVFTATEPTRLPPGRVGKLRIHKSGKVTLDWGGTNMEIRYGTEVNFLQDAVLVETPKPQDEGQERQSDSQTGKTYALGQIQQKMIVIPDWQKLYD